MSTITSQAMPDWPPRDSAWRYPEGTRKGGSTGQLFEVKNGRWVRINSLPDEPDALEFGAAARRVGPSTY